MVCVDPNDQDANILVVSEKGNGKRSEINDYRVTNRGGKGVKTIQVTDKTGQLIAIKLVHDSDDLMITTNNGVTIRMHVDSLRIMGRATQGVRLIRLDENDQIGDVAIVKKEEEAEVIEPIIDENLLDSDITDNEEGLHEEE
jgi:DNA gyrase subunit A